METVTVHGQSIFSNLTIETNTEYGLLSLLLIPSTRSLDNMHLQLASS